MKRAGLQIHSRAQAIRVRQRVPGAWHLRAADVDIWRASLDEPPDDAVAFFRTLLSTDEEERARRFYFDRDRRRFVVGRGILRLLLARYLGCPVSEIAFRYGPNGKPLLPADDGNAPIHFNVAHSESLALFAFARAGEIGVDLERVRDLPDWEYIASAYFSPREQARLRDCPADERRVEFFRAWTRQEAVLKANGLGLGMSQGGLPGTWPAGALATDGENPAFCASARPEFKLYPLQPVDGYAAAVAVPPDIRWATHTTWRFSQWLGRTRAVRRGRRTRLDQLATTRAEFL